MTLFSVVVATYERGPAIAPTLQSIADQTVADVEVLVVSDGPAAPGLAETVAAFGPRFSLHELPARTRSQSGPNNRGLELARGRYVAYLGHDDLWLPDHLAALAAVLDEQPDVDLVVSGCLYLGPPGQEDELTWVSGVFDAGDPVVPAEHFFPPSSIGQRHPLPPAVGPWPEDPSALLLPVDTTYLLGAAEAGCRFASTGRVSVVKFASALRYLSYLAPSDAEQRATARVLADAAAREAFVAERVAVARERGNFMTVRHSDPTTLAVGEAAARNEHVRGNALPPPTPLVDCAWIEPGDEWRGFDWHGLEVLEQRVWRWSGPSPSPRLAIPFTHPEPVLVRLHLRTDQGPLAPVTAVLVDGEPTPYALVDGPDGAAIELTTTLRDRLATVIELETAPYLLTDRVPADPLLVGVALSGIELETRAAVDARGTSGDASRAALQARLARLAPDHARARAELARVSEELELARRHAANLQDVREELEQALEVRADLLEKAEQARQRAQRRLRRLQRE